MQFLRHLLKIFLYVCERGSHKIKEHFYTLVIKFSVSPSLALTFLSSADSPLLAICAFHSKKTMTHISQYSDHVHPHSHLRTPPPNTSPFSHSRYSSFQCLRTQHNRPCHPLSTRLFGKTSLPVLPLSSILFFVLSTPLSYPSPLPALASAPFTTVSTLSHSPRIQQRVTRYPTFCCRPTRISPISPFIYRLINHFSSILLIRLAHKHILNPQDQAYSIPTPQISQSIMFHHATQFTDTAPPFLRVLLLISVMPFALILRLVLLLVPNSAVSRFVCRPLPRPSAPAPAILFLPASRFFFCSASALTKYAISRHLCFPSSFSLVFKALCLNTCRAVRFVSLRSARSATSSLQKVSQ